MNALLKLPDVVRLTGLSKACIYRNMNTGQFPRPVRISTRRVGWLETDLQSWLDEAKRTA